MTTRSSSRTLRGSLAASITLAGALALGAPPARAGLGVTELAAVGDDGPVTVFYPTDAAEQPLDLGRGVLRLSAARDAAPAAGNGRLVLVSHGSGGSPWVHADLARALADAGYVVAVPRHRGDNYLDEHTPGPESWDRRPAEASRAIDAVAADPRFGPRLQLQRVGVYGMSAGGHTALTLAGGRWSPARFAQHCTAHLTEDFNACVGLATSLNGGWLDGTKVTLANWILGVRFGGDATWRTYRDPRVAAVVAAVPHAASFEPESLAGPGVPLALATAAGDVWLHPRWHSDAVLASCTRCEVLPAPPTQATVHTSPLPAGLNGLVGRLLNDPPGFDRAAMAAVNSRIVGFFDHHLGAAATPQPPATAREATLLSE